jgi:hypothetical protein
MPNGDTTPLLPTINANAPSMRQESIAKAMRVEEPTIGVR